jgi:hypothetical protein
MDKEASPGHIRGTFPEQGWSVGKEGGAKPAGPRLEFSLADGSGRVRIQFPQIPEWRIPAILRELADSLSAPEVPIKPGDLDEIEPGDPKVVHPETKPPENETKTRKSETPALDDNVPSPKEAVQNVQAEDFISRMRAFDASMKADEGWTFCLIPLPDLGQPIVDRCHYCYRPRADYRVDGRCPIRGCTLGGGPPPTNPQNMVE